MLLPVGIDYALFYRIERLQLEDGVIIRHDIHDIRVTVITTLCCCICRDWGYSGAVWEIVEKFLRFLRNSEMKIRPSEGIREGSCAYLAPDSERSAQFLLFLNNPRR